MSAPLMNEYPPPRLRQMKKMFTQVVISRNSALSCRNTALALLCSLTVSACDNIPALTPYVFDMTRLNQDGSVNDGKDYASHPWACVLDNKSGLIWEVKKTEPGLQNMNNTYTWYDPNQDTNGGFAGKANGGVCTGSECDTTSYVKAVNAIKLCGLTDWHLPSRFEMGTIVDESVFFPGPTSPKDFFPEPLAGQFWTDSTFKTRRASAWAWRFDYGSEYITEKSDPLNVRLIHLDPAKPRTEASPAE